MLLRLQTEMPTNTSYEVVSTAFQISIETVINGNGSLLEISEGWERYGLFIH